MGKYIVLLLLLGYFSSYSQEDQKTYREKYRPQFHFSPEKGWIGDPCGFIFYQGQYHLFWWGKAVSKDLVRYQQVSDFVMKGEPRKISYFTGSMLVDKNNTAGFGKNALIANYTLFDPMTKNQSQGMSFSEDGTHFQYYTGNPTLDIGSTEFRDPTVIWHESSKQWIMVVAWALDKKIRFYSSKNLKHWTWMSDFGPKGDSDRAWECPDLFQVVVDGNPKNKKWVMVVSTNWARVQYFIGDFDGNSFKLMGGHPEQALYVDYGMDYYAPRVFQDYDHTLNTVTTMGWVAYWDYAQQVPSKWGKGFWSIPRNLELKTFPEGLRLVQKPHENLKVLRDNKGVQYSGQIPQGVTRLPKFSPKENTYEMETEFSTNKSNVIGLNLCVGEGRKVAFTYDTNSKTLLVDRTNCSDTTITKFPRISFAKVEPLDGKIKLHFYVDKSSIEVFANEGKEVFTLQTYAGEKQTGIELFALNSGSHLHFNAWNLKSIWENNTN